MGSMNWNSLSALPEQLKAKQTKVKQPADLLGFFNQKPDYPVCTRCNIGKLVPLFTGEPACSEACERRDTLPAPASDIFWATGSNRATCIWSDEKSARNWAANIRGLMVFKVRCPKAKLCWKRVVWIGTECEYADVPVGGALQLLEGPLPALVPPTPIYLPKSPFPAPSKP